MIVNSILGNIYTDSYTGKVIPIKFEWFEVDKKRIKKIANDGFELGILIEDILKDGDILAEINGMSYVCEIQKSHLTKIEVHSMQEMGRLCFELGNRHLSLKIEENAVTIPYDKPTFLYLDKLGFSVSQVEEKFSDFTECKAHGSSEKSHSHSHSHSHAHSHENGHSHSH